MACDQPCLLAKGPVPWQTKHNSSSSDHKRGKKNWWQGYCSTADFKSFDHLCAPLPISSLTQLSRYNRLVCYPNSPATSCSAHLPGCCPAPSHPHSAQPRWEQPVRQPSVQCDPLLWPQLMDCWRSLTTLGETESLLWNLKESPSFLGDR